jgi:hypothetical protein
VRLKPAACLALVAGLIASAAESRVVEISTPAVPSFHVDDAGPHWSYILSTDTYSRWTIGSNTRRWTSARPFDVG